MTQQNLLKATRKTTPCRLRLTYLSRTGTATMPSREGTYSRAMTTNWAMQRHVAYVSTSTSRVCKKVLLGTLLMCGICIMFIFLIYV